MGRIAQAGVRSFSFSDSVWERPLIIARFHLAHFLGALRSAMELPQQSRSQIDSGEELVQGPILRYQFVTINPLPPIGDEQLGVMGNVKLLFYNRGGSQIRSRAFSRSAKFGDGMASAIPFPDRFWGGACTRANSSLSIRYNQSVTPNWKRAIGGNRRRKTFVL